MGLAPSDFAGVIADATTLWRFIDGHAWTSEDALRAWADTQGITPDRANRALAMLQTLQRAYAFDDTPILPTPVDSTPPAPTGVTVHGTQAELSFNEPIAANHVPPNDAFTVSEDGNPVAVSSTLVSNNKVILELADAVGIGTTVTVSYAQPANDDKKLSDLTLNKAAAFADLPATNTTTLGAVLAAKTVPELKEIAKANGMEGYSKLSRDELVVELVGRGVSLEPMLEPVAAAE